MEHTEKIYQSWSLVIMAYNEEATIQTVCQQAVSFLSILPDNKKEILIIDDGSTDGTFEKIKNLTKKFSFVKVYRNERNFGIGAVLARGYKMSKMENICVVPGDGQFDLNELRAFRNVPAHTIISFYRISYKGYSFFRKLVTWGNKWINKILFGFYLRDVNYVKIYKKDSLKKYIGLISNKFSENPQFLSKSNYIESEIIYFLTRKKLTIIQTPAEYLPRIYGISKAVQPKILIMVFKDIFQLLKFRFASKYQKDLI